MIKSITLGGFRGVVHPLPIELLKGGKPCSLMIFGRNGTGKSSVTDAWEWFHTGSIEHLAREGAKAGAYPTRLPGGVTPPEGFVEVVFQDASVGTVRQTLTTGRNPAATNVAGLNWFRQRATHPCHIRFEDLNRFVYMTKTERFDALAELMGFKEQVELQKALRRVETKLADKLSAAQRDHAVHAASLARHLELGSGVAPSSGSVLSWCATLLNRHGVSASATLPEIRRGLLELTTRVERDERAKELKDVQALARCLERLTLPELSNPLSSYAAALGKFRAEERATVADMLVGLYKRGEAAVTRQRGVKGDDPDLCPLCGQAYAGDLLSHIHGELLALEAVRAAHSAANTAREAARQLLPTPSALVDALAQGVADAGEAAKQFDVKQLQTRCDELGRLIEILRSLLESSCDEHTDESAEQLERTGTSVGAVIEAIVAERESLRALVAARLTELADDGARAKLVADHASLARCLDLVKNFRDTHRSTAALAHCQDEYRALVERYVAMNIEDVESRFAAISADVDRYFGILEAGTQGVAHPALKLVRDQDRAVILEVEFRGERISPAYSYLSESQLNSFGLAVFLASVRHVNTEFRLVILDDVVNSFDAYKRPQMIRLLKDEFSDSQVIVLTHDDMWWAQLMEQCPQWGRLRIKRYETGIGPILEVAKSEREQVEGYLQDDLPTEAARALGPMLERKLQSLCASMEVSITYNTRNEYTLRPLLQSLMSRAKDKLGDQHPLFAAVKALDENVTFRNFSAHWKDPASGLTTPEVGAVLDQWSQVETQVLCAQPKCGVLIAWRGEAAAVALKKSETAQGAAGER